MKQTTYRFSHEHHPSIAGLNLPAWETATPGLVVSAFGENPEDGGPFALTHAPSGWALIHGTDKRHKEELGLTAGALGGLPVDWTASGADVMRQVSLLDDLALRIFLLLVKRKQKLRPAEVDSERLDIAKRAAGIGVEQLRQAEQHKKLAAQPSGSAKKGSRK